MPQIAVKDANGVTQSLEEPLAPGRASAALSRPVVLSNEDNATIGALTETAPASDTASSGLNGRLQRIAQRLTSLIALLPTSLGTKTAANSLPVTLASDGALSVAAGATSDAAWTSGNGTLVGLLKAIATNVASTSPSPIIQSLPYQAVAISQTAKVLGATGAIGDSLAGIIIQPTGTTVGSVILYDNMTAVYTYPGGTVGADLRPIIVGMGMVCVGAGWHVTTPSNATVLALGKFT